MGALWRVTAGEAILVRGPGPLPPPGPLRNTALLPEAHTSLARSIQTISDIVNPYAPATYSRYGVLHEQYLVNGGFHVGPRILSWSRGEDDSDLTVRRGVWNFFQYSRPI